MNAINTVFGDRQGTLRIIRMNLEDARKILDAEVIVGTNLEEIEVEMGCGADLMSDVLAFGKKGSLLLSGLTNPQVIRTCDIAEIIGICFVRGKRPSEETITMARQQSLPLLATRVPMFESCGRLYYHGLKGCSETSGWMQEGIPGESK